jgi:hypothetical protein
MWFALGGALKVFLAHSSGKTIEMIVCSGAGIKKVYVNLPSAEQVNHEVSVKHCSNTPLALSTKEWNTLEHLAYVAPDTQSTLHFAQGLPVHRNWLRNRRPPPGRAPPAHLTA